jgi:hypothetical protein
VKSRCYEFPHYAVFSSLSLCHPFCIGKGGGGEIEEKGRREEEDKEKLIVF